MKRRAPGGYAIFCESVRHEITGQTSLVGVWQTHLSVPAFPAQLDSFCALFYYRQKLEDAALDVLLQIELESGGINRIFASEVIPAPQFSEAALAPENRKFPYVGMTGDFRLRNIVFPEAGVIRASAIRSGVKYHLGAIGLQGDEE